MSHDHAVPLGLDHAFDPYGGARPPEVLTGALLVATPRLTDPNFSRRVVLVLEDGKHGSLGVVLDRPGGVAVGEILPQWQPVATSPGELFTGGPVARNAIIGLVRLSDDDPAEGGPALRPEGWKLLVDGDQPVGTADLGADPAGCAEVIVGARLFSGYAGWSGGQLQHEIDEGSWYVLPCQEHDPISADPEGLWRRVLRRQGGALAMVAGFPSDPAWN